MKLKKIAVLVVAFILMITAFAGCAKPETMATVKDADGNVVGTVSFDEYLFWAYYNYAYYDAYYENYYYYFQTYFKDTLDDIYDPDAEEPITVNQFLTDSLVGDLKQQFVILKLFNEYGLTFGADEITDVASYYNSMVSNYGETTVKKIRARLGMNETQFKEMLRSLVKISCVQEHLFGEGGSMAVTSEQAKAHLLENYLQVKHIYIGTSYTVTEDEKKVTKTRTEQEVQELVDKIKSEYEANPTLENFLSLVEKYSEDTGSIKTTTTDNVTTHDKTYCSATYNSSFGALSVTEYGGYVFDKEYNNFYSEFTDLAKELKENEIGTCKVTSQSTDNKVTGMHIILKLDLAKSESTVNKMMEVKDDYETPYINIITENKVFTDLLDAEIAKLTFEFDEALLEKYSMKNLKSI
ncbi:MAG: hypothetical protein IKA51_00925 [Clostridia bacterium]|nr:hypothetical protein [Clostridia bacterium]